MAALAGLPDSATAADPHQDLDGRAFALVVRRIANSLDLGSDLSSHLGSGTDYAQSRPFVDGDDVRIIDWRVTARTGRWYEKEYESLRRMPLVLVVDTSASMRIGSVRPSKYELAVRLAGGIALAGLQRNSPVALVGAGEAIIRHPPSLSHAQVFIWLHQLRRLGHVRDGERTRLAQRVDELLGRLACRSLVVVLSDLHDPAAHNALRRLHLAHDCAVLALVDPAERGELRAGFVDADEAETGLRHRLGGRSRWTVAGTAAHALASAGIDALEVPIEQPVIDRVARFFAHRDRRARGTR